MKFLIIINYNLPIDILKKFKNNKQITTMTINGNINPNWDYYDHTFHNQQIINMSGVRQLLLERKLWDFASYYTIAIGQLSSADFVIDHTMTDIYQVVLDKMKKVESYNWGFETKFT